MKKQIAFAASILVSVAAMAQESQPATPYFKIKPYFKSYNDHLLPKAGAPHTGINFAPEINGNTIGNPALDKLRLQLINITSRGAIHYYAPDNMPVLAPDMNQPALMPGSSRTYKPAPPSAMPNPLYPRDNKTSR